MIKSIQIVNVPVSDQDRAYRFYVDTLGMTVVTDQEAGPYGRFLQVAPVGAVSTLSLTSGPQGSTSGSLSLILESSDIEADVATLRERGVGFPEGIQDLPWARRAGFSDPDGNQLVLQTALTDDAGPRRSD